MSPDELADAYWEHTRRFDSPEREDRLRADDLSWAYAAVEAFVRGEPTSDWGMREAGRPERTADCLGLDRLDFIVRLIERAPPEQWWMIRLGAGPMESYLESEPDVSRVDQLAQSNPRFRMALRCAWFDSELSPEDAARLRRFGAPL